MSSGSFVYSIGTGSAILFPFSSEHIILQKAMQASSRSLGLADLTQPRFLKTDVQIQKCNQRVYIHRKLWQRAGGLSVSLPLQCCLTLPEVAWAIRQSHFMACCGKQLFFRDCNTPEQGWLCRSAGAAPAASGHWHVLAKSTKGL